MTAARNPYDWAPRALILPPLLMLAAVFAGPLIWFFVSTLGSNDSGRSLLAEASMIMSSRAVLTAIWTTNWISLLVTATVLLIGYPIAYYLVGCGRFRFMLVLFCIIVPYFTSIIVRTYSWMVILGRNGLINQALIASGVTDAPLKLLYNTGSIVIGMVYILLPYMILTLFAAMKSIDLGLVRAAKGLGASSSYAFSRIYFPLSIHGILSGSLIVFILSIGFFITPALLGGPSDVTIAMLIEREIEITFDWASASVMSLVLLLVTLVLYGIYCRFTDLDRMMGG